MHGSFAAPEIRREGRLIHAGGRSLRRKRAPRSSEREKRSSGLTEFSSGLTEFDAGSALFDEETASVSSLHDRLHPEPIPVRSIVRTIVSPSSFGIGLGPLVSLKCVRARARACAPVSSRRSLRATAVPPPVRQTRPRTDTRSIAAVVASVRHARSLFLLSLLTTIPVPASADTPAPSAPAHPTVVPPKASDRPAAPDPSPEKPAPEEPRDRSPSSRSSPKGPDYQVALTFDDADLSDFVRTIGQLTGRRFVVASAHAKGVKATLYAPEKVTGRRGVSGLPRRLAGNLPHRDPARRVLEDHRHPGHHQAAHARRARRRSGDRRRALRQRASCVFITSTRRTSPRTS